MSCGCKNKVAGYVDVSNIKSVPWDCVPYVLGREECGRIVVLDKPLNELTDEDREKLDVIRLDGDGTYFLADDGTYKKIENDTESIVLQYDENPANFVINNQPLLSMIWERAEKGIESFVRMHIDPYTLPLNYAYGTRTLILEYDRPVITVNGDDIEYKRLRILIGMYTDVYPFNVIYYEVKQFVDADGIVVTDGDGASALFNDGDYKLTYTKEQVDALVDGLTDLINEGGEAVDALRLRVMALEGTVEELDGRVAQNATSISDLQESTEAAFETVNSSLTELSDRVTENTTDIEKNTSDIESLRTDITNQEKFRGYFGTTDEVTTIPNPTPGDYAWNAETGTVWSYNGTTWYNTTTPIPDQSVDAYDGIPLMDGTGDAGSTNRYSRGDHRHPSDDSKADATALNDYLPLAGNTQTTRMTGDVWMASGRNLRITNSGNSYIGQNTSTNTTEVVGNGVGGVDLISGNGTAKANGQEIVTYDENDDIRAKNDIYLGNDNNLFGIGADGTAHNLIEKSRWGIVDVGSTRVPLNFSSSVRPTAQIGAETGAQSHPIAYLSDVTSAQSTLQAAIDANTSAIEGNTNDIGTNTADIESILNRLAEEENFRGYKLTTDDVTAITNPQNGNYAYNVQTGTIWIYNGTTWSNSGEAIPDGAIQASDLLPLMDGNADTGNSNQYSRGDHVHPSDTSKAEASDLIATDNRVSALSTDLSNYKSSTDSALSMVETAVATNTGNLSNVTTRVGTAETNISNLQGQAATIGTQVNDLNSGLADAVGRIGTNELNIESLFSLVNENENFKGYFLTNAEITQLPGTSGDFAWSAESGTIWVYDASVPSWTDSGDPIPQEAVSFYNGDPLVNGTASPGESTMVSRGDHVHPSDPTKANTEDIPTAVSQLANDSGYISSTEVAAGYVPVATYNALVARVAALEGILSGVSGFWTGTEAEYEAIDPKDPNTYYHTYEQ